MAKDPWALFQELLEQEIALGLVAVPEDFLGTTQLVVTVTDPCEADTKEYEPDFDTKRILPITFSDLGD